MSIQHPTASLKFDFEMMQQESEATSSQSSEEKSLTQIGSCNLEKSNKTEATTVEKSFHKCISPQSKLFLSNSSKNPLKSLSSRLHKKLCKKSSPNKESSDSQQDASKTITFSKG